MAILVQAMVLPSGACNWCHGEDIAKNGYGTCDYCAGASQVPDLLEQIKDLEKDKTDLEEELRDERRDNKNLTGELRDLKEKIVALGAQLAALKGLAE